MRNRISAIGVMLAAAAAFAEEKPQDVLKRAVKSTVEAKSWVVAIENTGGVATGPSHEISAPDVRGSYTVERTGKLRHLIQPFQAYMIVGNRGGAGQSGDRWLALTSFKEGRLLDALAPALDEVLAEAFSLKKSVVRLDDGRLELRGNGNLALTHLNGLIRTNIFVDDEELAREKENYDWPQPEMLKQCDRTRGQVIYRLTVDATAGHLTQVERAIVFAHKDTPKNEDPTAGRHIAWVTRFAISRLDGVELPEIPADAQAHLR